MFMTNNLSFNFVETSPYPWEKDDAVMQILVFACQRDKDSADKYLKENNYNYYEEITNSPFTNYSVEGNLGAIFKMRAVRNVHGNWIALIKSPVTGYTLIGSNKTYSTYQEAFDKCREFIYK